MTTITKSLAADFGGTIAPGRLRDEINANQIITIHCAGVTVTGDVVSISFLAPLSTSELAELDIVIYSHDGTTPEDIDTAKDQEGRLLVKVQPATSSYDMVDRDILLRTATMGTGAVEDLKVDLATMIETPWGECAHVGCYKADGSACLDQAEADVSAVLSVYDYQAIDQSESPPSTPIQYELRDGGIIIDPAIPQAERTSHRVYAVIAPGIPASMGGSVRTFDGYLASDLAAKSPVAKLLDPTLNAAASVIRIFIFHPAGAKREHLLRLVTYREAAKT